MSIRNNNPKLNEEKTREIILYLLEKCGSMNRKKLELLLYFVSYDYYELEENHLTGLKFFKSKKGIKIKKLSGILNRMLKQKQVKII